MKEWFQTTDISKLAEYSVKDHRKFRLFACAAVRKVWHLLEKNTRHIVEVAERFADKRASQEELKRSWEMGLESARKVSARWKTNNRERYINAALAATFATGHDTYVVSLAVSVANEVVNAHERYLSIKQQLADLFRDTINPHLEGVRIPRTPDITNLAQAAYECRNEGQLDPARLAVLSDALEEADCDSPDVLTQLRSKKALYRGCWSLDFILENH